MRLKITALGNSVGVILPRELLFRLHLAEGDTVFAVETPDGLRLTPHDPEFEAQLAVAEQLMHEDRDVLYHLAQTG